MLEVESGSNDPVSYMLTVIALGFMSAGQSGNVAITVIQQVLFGVIIGVLLAKLVILVLDLEVFSIFDIF